ncbi:MAG: PD-(D/E)XK nuclease family protein, partial [Treponema sp.]|nr:PD-(D/E)XK nuclease family protein [Treponema sp.]
MNVIKAIIRREITKQESCFVFPSEAASSGWARRACDFTGVRSVALNRFMAWDRFKERAINAAAPDKRPVSRVLRRLFVRSLIGENARELKLREGETPVEEGRLPFRFLIPPEYAEEGAVFTSALTDLLPSLGYWKTLTEKKGINLDGEDRDLLLLEREYRAFLEKYRLFEPSWEIPSREGGGNRYFIFYPELIEDFAEYEPFLKSAGERYQWIFMEKGGDLPPLRRFATIREELRSTVLEIRRLHGEEHIPFEEMALSVPELPEIEPYLLREFSLYQIPLRRRFGKPLGEYGAGRLFSLIYDCGANNFSFSTLKALVLNTSLPWRYPSKNEELILFGIENNCVSGYREGGEQRDVWEEAFKLSVNAREKELQGYYRTLKQKLVALSAAHSFTALRRAYFSFRGNRALFEDPAAGAKSLFSREHCSAESDAVLGRCVEELSALIQIEKDLGLTGENPRLMPPSPLVFFISLLQEKQYVPKGYEAGVNLFQYRVAAAAPFACHFVLNASQSSATVLYQPLKFLRRDKREKLNLTDGDASACFFRAYQPWDEGRSCLRISASDRTFSGWTIPHSFFSDSFLMEGDLPQGEDFFAGEKNWWAFSGKPGEGPAFPARLFSLQKEGFDHFKTLLPRPGSFDLTKPCGPFPDGAYQPVLNRLKAVQWEERERPGGGKESLLRVSATDLNDFFTCSLFWLYKKIFIIREFSPEAQLLDDASRGLLYHRILEKLFTRIREEEGIFNPEHLEIYRRWIQFYTRETVQKESAFKGPLASPLVSAQAKTIERRIFALLKTEAKYFSGYTVTILESSFKVFRDGLLLNGIIDRVSCSPEGDPVIFDYKTGAIPSRGDSILSESSTLANFQIPLYIKLYEESQSPPGKGVGGAVFMSIMNREISAVVGKFPGKREIGR